MQLILLRHGEAERQTQTDELRMLTARGQQQASQMCSQLLAKVRPSRFLVSPLLRAQQTLAPLRRALPHVPVDVIEHIKPDDSARIALDVLSGYSDDCIVVVCHMNIIASLGGLLLAEPPESFDLAEARCYDLAVIAAGLGQERWRLTPHFEQ